MIKVLVIDDSVVFRSQICAALGTSSFVEVVGSASNGSIALQKLAQLQVDLVTLDMEMPDMDGIEVLKEIRKRGLKTRVIVFSSQTTKGAEKALAALSAGADDVIAKPSGEDNSTLSPTERIKEVLVPKVLQFLSGGHPFLFEKLKQEISEAEKGGSSAGIFEKLPVETFQPSIIVIASSTGGPTALEAIFSKLTPPFKIPILIAQHMPPVFTQILAKRLFDLSGITCKEAEQGEVVYPGIIYIAPGNFHMQIARAGNETKIVLNQEPQRNFVRPSADFLFESTAELFGKKSFGIVLTGMGEDGLQGSQAIKKSGGRILIQDEKSCVVFGMPGAVYKADCYDAIGNLEKISRIIGQMSKEC